ncbi:MAG TPA: zinc ribbon domain-containing protein [Verrucomicrobia bacterium]|jgi:putative FmdB family regulatory protein|nr:zinc ribbon domain-containing protein [Verrucomicrobiota bacterium]
MPIYEYHCKDCHHEFERIVPTAAQADGQDCPQCSGHHTERKLSAFAVATPSHSHSAPSCASGACGMPGPSPCAGGACNLGF